MASDPLMEIKCDLAQLRARSEAELRELGKDSNLQHIGYKLAKGELQMDNLSSLAQKGLLEGYLACLQELETRIAERECQPAHDCEFCNAGLDKQGRTCWHCRGSGQFRQVG